MRRRLQREHVVGFDLSLRATAACALPLEWDLDLERAVTTTSGYPLDSEADAEALIRRVDHIVRDLVLFCGVYRAKHIFIEGLAFSQQSNRAHALAELHGAVKLTFFRELGIVVEPFTASFARKVLLQKLPKKDSKAFTLANVRRFTAVAEWTEDEIDAFVVANAGLMRTGGVAMSFPGT